MLSSGRLSVHSVEEAGLIYKILQENPSWQWERAVNALRESKAAGALVGEAEQAALKPVAKEAAKDIAKGVAKTSAKKLGKLLLASVPIVGMAPGVASAEENFKEGHNL